ncbi:MAG: deoxyribose-phosphate aldolase [Synergistaceae bacterium]|jgi:deoxyribose-phosphate aldolase|nr:deoxyribose-phosphate aldolase [Synergistaceae bacterium]
MNKLEFARYVDHSLLKPNLTQEQIISGCKLAMELRCASVCVNPVSIALSRDVLRGSGVAVGTVIGFPSGAHTAYIKALEAEEAYRLGAAELDMVINVGALKSGRHAEVLKDIEAVVNATPGIVKVILETCFLTDDEKALGSKLAEEAGAHYVKTSTGFAAGGATIKDILLIKKSVSGGIKIKAAGGIADLDFSLKLIEAGCDRIGISRTAEIIKGLD